MLGMCVGGEECLWGTRSRYTIWEIQDGFEMVSTVLLTTPIATTARELPPSEIWLLVAELHVVGYRAGIPLVMASRWCKGAQCCSPLPSVTTP